MYWLLSRFADFMNSGPRIFWWVPGLMVLTVPIALLHEVGHAVAARRLLPGRVFVDVGMGPVRWTFELWGIRFRLAPVVSPAGLAGVCRFEGNPSASELATISLAGPAVTLAGWFAAALALGHVHGLLHAIVWLAAFGQLFGFALSMVPLRIAYPGGRVLPTDGWHALDAVRHMRAAA